MLVGPNEGSADIAVSDAGASELNRAWWSMQETTTDAVKNAWGDAGIPELNLNTWTTTKNNSIFAVYNRVMIMITRVNEFLRETTDSKLASWREWRAIRHNPALSCRGSLPTRLCLLMGLMDSDVCPLRPRSSRLE